ncbi:activator of 90 kDa heat shock protein ATPase homolog 1 isoform X2 [Pseudonaja textilis]|nr:activator of 90 kDa heat shock protein ATPase homolog 1 isoform X2 [Pseudonaja textilis]
MDDIEINVGLAKDEPDTNLLYLMKQEGAKQISNAMETYISTLKTEFTQGMILPTLNGEQSESQNHPVPKAVKHKINEQVAGNSSASKSVGVKIPTCKINLKDIFLTSPEDLYRVFITQEMVQAFTHSSAVVEADKGGKFQLLNGIVTGEFIELVSAKQIAMKWRFKSWPEGHFATIVLSFIDKGNETEVCLEGKGIPATEEERTKEGWQRYYFEGIKQTFGYGARLF